MTIDVAQLVRFIGARLSEIESIARSVPSHPGGEPYPSQFAWTAELNENQNQTLVKDGAGWSIAIVCRRTIARHLLMHDPQAVLDDVVASCALLTQALANEEWLDRMHGCKHSIEQIQEGGCPDPSTELLNTLCWLAWRHRRHSDWLPSWTPCATDYIDAPDRD